MATLRASRRSRTSPEVALVADSFIWDNNILPLAFVPHSRSARKSLSNSNFRAFESVSSIALASPSYHVARMSAPTTDLETQ